MSLYAIGDLHLHYQSVLKAPGQLHDQPDRVAPGRDLEMKMICHETKGMECEGILSSYLFQKKHEHPVILFFPENISFVISSPHHMEAGTFVPHAFFPRHQIMAAPPVCTH